MTPEQNTTRSPDEPMNTSNEERERLKRLAEAATPGPWKVWSSLYEGMAAAVVHDVEPLETVAELRAYRNAAFIAAANPATILSLIADLEAQAARVKALEEGLRPLADTIPDTTDGDARFYGWSPNNITYGDCLRASALLHQDTQPSEADHGR